MNSHTAACYVYYYAPDIVCSVAKCAWPCYILQDVVMMCHEVEKALDVKLRDMPAQVSPQARHLVILSPESVPLERGGL